MQCVLPGQCHAAQVDLRIRFKCDGNGIQQAGDRICLNKKQQKNRKLTKMSSELDKPKLLIVDTAPAMAQVLKNYAEQNNYEFDAFSDSAQACTALTDRFSNHGKTGGYDCIVLGWPQGEVRIISDLLIALASAENSDLPLIVLSEEPDKELQTLARRRAKTRTLLWREHKRIESVLTGIVIKEGPVRKSPAATEVPSSIQNRLPTSVLLVDESPAICHRLRDLLETNGYFVALASSAADARSEIAKNNFDLVLTEFFLREESGEELCLYLQSLSPEIRPVYAVMTRKNLDSVVQCSLAIGAIACLDKSESTEILYARINAIATGLSSRAVAHATASLPVQTATPDLAEMLEEVKLPTLLIGDRRTILAANKEAAKLLSAGDAQALRRKNFEKAIHGAPVKRTLEDPVKALFRTLDGRSLSVAYRSRDVDVTEYGLSDNVCMLTFESIETNKPVTVSSITTPGSVVQPYEWSDELADTCDMTEAVNLLSESRDVSPDPVSESVLTQIERALNAEDEERVFSLLMLDIKMVASVTGDRLSLAHSKPMREMVEVELAGHCAQNGMLEYIGDGRYLILYKSDRVAQTRSFAMNLTKQVPNLISQLTDVELLSHASFVELPRRCDLSVSYILKHCSAACLKNELDGKDNEIYDIGVLEVSGEEKVSSIAPKPQDTTVYDQQQESQYVAQPA